LGNAAHDGLPWTVEKIGIITLKTVIRVQAAFAENRWTADGFVEGIASMRARIRLLAFF
jgi:hypothetical protein